jgi:predicted aldo/keto reductase-like oxidoreductase
MGNQSDIDMLYAKGGLIEWAMKQRDAGLIKYIGFTGHFNPAIHIEIIRRGFEWDTVQFPVNLADFNHSGLSFIRDVLPLAVEKNIGVIAMKTNAYGRPWIREVATPTEGLRYAMSHPISTMASGMTSVEIMNQNIATVKNMKPMDEEESKTYVARLKGIPDDLEDYRRDFKPREVKVEEVKPGA